MRRVFKRLGCLTIVTLATVVAGLFALDYWFFGGTYEPVGREDLVVVPEPSFPGEDAWRSCLRELENAQQVAVRFHKQERIEGRLEPISTLETKQRRRPLSIYLRWVSPFADREAIYQENLRDGDLIVHEGGALLHFSPTALLKPHGKLALRFSRHPVTELNIWRLNERALEYVRRAREDPAMRATVELVTFRTRPTTLYEIIHSPSASEKFGYHRISVYIDHELAIPTRWELYQLPTADKPDESPLLEYIEFDPPNFQPGLTDEDFDPANKNYHYNLKQVIAPEPAPEKTSEEKQ
jgi:Protein of unknown function (DUF1571)